MSLFNTQTLGYVQQSVTTAANLSTVASGATGALISVETQAVRWRADGTDPTSTVGMPIAVGATLDYKGDLSKLRIVSQSTAASVNINYYSTRTP